MIRTAVALSDLQWTLTLPLALHPANRDRSERRQRWRRDPHGQSGAVAVAFSRINSMRSSRRTSARPRRSPLPLPSDRVAESALKPQRGGQVDQKSGRV